MGKSLLPKGRRPLQDILVVDLSYMANASELLDETGVAGLCEAYCEGYLISEIAEALGCGRFAILKWENLLKDEDKELIKISKTANLEQFEHHLTHKMLGISEFKEEDEPNTEGLEEKEKQRLLDRHVERQLRRAKLHDTRVRTIERVLKATQNRLKRYQGKEEKANFNFEVQASTLELTSPEIAGMLLKLGKDEK